MTRRCGLPSGRRHVFSAFVLVLATAALIGSAAPAKGSMSLGTTTTLTRDVVHYLSAATLLGPVPASQQVTVGVVLNNPNQGAEDSYLAQLYDSSSSLYQQFLDPDTFNQQFGVPATTKVVAELKETQWDGTTVWSILENAGVRMTENASCAACLGGPRPPPPARARTHPSFHRRQKSRSCHPPRSPCS